MVLEAESRLKVEAARARACVNAGVREVSLRGGDGIQKAAHAHLKGLENADTPALLGEDRRDGEALFDPNEPVQTRVGDKIELPLLDQALHACRAEAAKAEHARPPISDAAEARAVPLLRNKKGIGTDRWTPLELKALPDAAIGRLAFIVRQIDVRLAFLLQCLTNLSCLLPKPGGGERPIVLQSLLHVLWSSCHAESIRGWDEARPRFWDSAVRGCSALQFATRRRLLQDVVVIHGTSVLGPPEVLWLH